ncbi:MAG: hypothetical protein WC747_04050 [Candidatus Babeliales bacterium]
MKIYVKNYFLLLGLSISTACFSSLPGTVVTQTSDGNVIPYAIQIRLVDGTLFHVVTNQTPTATSLTETINEINLGQEVEGGNPLSNAQNSFESYQDRHHLPSQENSDKDDNCCCFCDCLSQCLYWVAHENYCCS